MTAPDAMMAWVGRCSWKRPGGYALELGESQRGKYSPGLATVEMDRRDGELSVSSLLGF